jgi:hypothetical protein
MGRNQGEKRYVLRGYVLDRGDGRVLAICLRPYLVVEGRTVGEAKHRLHSLTHAYLVDACQDDRLDDAMSRRAPVRYYARYAVGQVQSFVHAFNSVKPFTETCCLPQHA